ncbi:MAG TPA: nucleotidyltransferase domain-containing protein [Vicinamibacteria bacterium]|nr:nucleotidyltransferase domain-containing protein [Vicinamibacteria bacterium]
MPHRSSSSAGATHLDRAERIDELRQAASRAKKNVPGIERIVLFGSLVAGNPTPRSDADLLVVVDTSSHREPRNRNPEMMGTLAPLPCPLDLFVLTRDEVERFQ